jgi:hypothetical protein
VKPATFYGPKWVLVIEAPLVFGGMILAEQGQARDEARSALIKLWKTTAAQRFLAQAGHMPRADADRGDARQTFAPWMRGVGRRAKLSCPRLAGAVPLKS